VILGFIGRKNEGELMTSFENVVAYVAQPSLDAVLDKRVAAGANFDPSAMCEHCRTNPEADAPRSIGNVSFFSRCTYLNGCVVCGFCGAGLFDGMGDGKGIPDCPECGGVELALGSGFSDDHDGLEASKQAFINWHRKMRSLEVFAAAVGMTVFLSREDGCPMGEDHVNGLFHSALEAIRLPEIDEYVNLFFDRVQDAMRAAREQPSPVSAPLRLVTNVDSPA
jgi:hypothetical protein